MSPLAMRLFTLVGIALAMACMQMKAREDDGPPAVQAAQAGLAAASFRPTN